METFENALQPGAILGEQYRIESVLGEGGFGITYKALDEKLDRHVAIKEFIPIELAARGSDSITVQARTNRSDDYKFGIQRFLDEARALAKFQHNHIVHVLNYLEANGTAYIVMGFEEGQPLDEWLKQHPTLNEDIILKIITPILEGLAEVHKAGLLHRDIKPGNIFMRKQGGPMLIDFGAARHALGEHSKSISAIISQGYAPPEQYTTRGKQGAYTDLYAIGAVMYQLVTGKAPIESVDRSHDMMSGEPDPLVPTIEAGKGKVDDWLLLLTDQLLIITPNDRPQTVDIVVEALRNKSMLSVSAEQGGQQVSSNKTRVVSADDRFRAESAVSQTGSSRQAAEERQPSGGIKGLFVAVVIMAAVAVGGAGWWFTQQGGFGSSTEVVATAEERDAQTGRSILIVHSEPENAKVYLNDVLLGQTPYRNDSLRSGLHKLKIIHPQSNDESDQIVLKDDVIIKRNFTLKPATGNVNLFSKPDGASIEVDGKATGYFTPYTLEDISVGNHSLVLRKDRYYPKKASLVVVKGKTVRDEYTLDGGHLVKYGEKWVEPAERDRLVEEVKQERLAAEKKKRELEAKRVATEKKNRELAAKRAAEEKRKRDSEAQRIARAQQFQVNDAPGLDSATLKSIERKILNDDYSSNVYLKAPDIAENGAVVPITASYKANQTGISRFVVLSDASHDRVLMHGKFKSGVDLYYSTRIKMKSTGTVYVAFVLSNGQVHVAKHLIRVTIGSSNKSSNGSAAISSRSLKARAKGGTVKMLINHPMSPNDYLNKVSISSGGISYVETFLTSSMSKNPFFSYKIGNVNRFDIEIQNNNGASASSEVKMK